MADNNGRCVASLSSFNGNWTANVPIEECEKFPNQYSTHPWGGDCVYCAGTFDQTTGVCSTTDCTRSYGEVWLYGLSENMCTQQCGGTFNKYGWIGRCHLP